MDFDGHNQKLGIRAATERVPTVWCWREVEEFCLDWHHNLKQNVQNARFV